MAAAEDSFPYLSYNVVSPGYITTFLLTVLLYDDYVYACWIKKNVREDVGVAYLCGVCVQSMAGITEERH